MGGGAPSSLETGASGAPPGVAPSVVAASEVAPSGAASVLGRSSLHTSQNSFSGGALSLRRGAGPPRPGRRPPRPPAFSGRGPAVTPGPEAGGRRGRARARGGARSH